VEVFYRMSTNLSRKVKYARQSVLLEADCLGLVGGVPEGLYGLFVEGEEYLGLGALLSAGCHCVFGVGRM